MTVLIIAVIFVGSISCFYLGWYLRDRIQPNSFIINGNDVDSSFISANVECDVCTNNWHEVFHESVEQLECQNCQQLRSFEILEVSK